MRRVLKTQNAVTWKSHLRPRREPRPRGVPTTRKPFLSQHINGHCNFQGHQAHAGWHQSMGTPHSLAASRTMPTTLHLFGTAQLQPVWPQQHRDTQNALAHMATAIHRILPLQMITVRTVHMQTQISHGNCWRWASMVLTQHNSRIYLYAQLPKDKPTLGKGTCKTYLDPCLFQFGHPKVEAVNKNNAL